MKLKEVKRRKKETNKLNIKPSTAKEQD